MGDGESGKKERAPIQRVFEQETQPPVTTALFDIWGVLLSRKADNWCLEERLKRFSVGINKKKNESTQNKGLTAC